MSKKFNGPNPKTWPLIAATATATAAAAAIGGGLAQLPGSDAGPLVALESALVMALARVHRVDITAAAATDLVLTFAATFVGRGITEVVIGWIPGLGNAVNALTAAGLVVAVGLTADAHFASLVGEGA